MNRVVFWPFATPMDDFGKAVDEFQGIYSRGLCRALAEGLLRTELCEVAVLMPITLISNMKSWAVMGREWSFQEAMCLTLPENTQFLVFGTMTLSNRFDTHMLLLSVAEKRLIVDRQFSDSRARLLECLSEIVNVLASALVRRSLTDDEYYNSQQWGTCDAEAYLAYLEGWSASAGLRFGISMPNPEAVLPTLLRALTIDPAFKQPKVEAYRLQNQMGICTEKSLSDELEVTEWRGYSEWECPIKIP